RVPQTGRTAHRFRRATPKRTVFNPLDVIHLLRRAIRELRRLRRFRTPFATRAVRQHTDVKLLDEQFPNAAFRPTLAPLRSRNVLAREDVTDAAIAKTFGRELKDAAHDRGLRFVDSVLSMITDCDCVVPVHDSAVRVPERSSSSFCP